MKGLYKYILLFIVFLFFISNITMPTAAVAAAYSEQSVIKEIQIIVETPGAEWTIDEIMTLPEGEGWMKASTEKPLLDPLNPIQSAWIKFQLPKLEMARPAMMFSRLYAKNVEIYLNDTKIFESKRSYSYNKNHILLTLNNDEEYETVFIKLESDLQKVGFGNAIQLDEYEVLSKELMKSQIFDFVLGSTLLFVALFMGISSFFLRRSFLVGWGSLCSVILCIGVMILSYSPYFYLTFSEIGAVAYYSFDIALTILMPSIFIFFESIFGKGPYKLIHRYRKLLIIFTSISILMFAISFAGDFYKDLYKIVGMLSVVVAILFGNLLLIACLIIYCFKRNKDAYVLAAGIGIFSSIVIVEVIYFYAQSKIYELIYWKLGVVIFIISLIVILVKKIVNNYDQVVIYSKQLEAFNHELQRSEKMDMISQLAASVAHEVRNPLQVTRGFLQLLSNKTVNDKDKSYMVLAIDELDRASSIITDFLTFAKPQIESTTLLNIKDEIEQIQGILLPLASIQGATLIVNADAQLYIQGNSSKLKQALINIIKNGIEALSTNGEIYINAYMDQKEHQVVLKIKDNGEGMNESDIQRLGEPYYSKKTKGTGLGLMVTFSIVEAMQGSLTFTSEKGVGTEATIRFHSTKASEH